MQAMASRMASWITDLRFESIPPVAVQRAKQCILDQIGIQLRGAALPQVQPVRALVFGMGGSAEATVLSTGRKFPVSSAAYANGTFGHSCEFDDSHFHCGHPGVCVIPAALAMAERERSSGRDFITAVVAGYQAQTCCVGPIHHGTLKLGWHGTKIGGVFGAAAAAARLLELDTSQTAHALSVAASDASGTMEYDQSGGEVKRLHAGAASRSGVQAALLAQLGMTGPAQIFEGKRGIFKLFGDGSPPAIDAYWTGRFHILDTMFKLYPAVGTVHAALNALTELQRRHSFDHTQIDDIHVGLAEWAILHGAAITRPTDCLSAQFSLAFSMALRAVKRRNDLPSYLDPSLWADPLILAIADRVKPYAIKFEPGAPELGATVEVALNSGQRHEFHQRAPRGYAENPASEEDLQEKFRGLVEGILPTDRTAHVITLIDRLEEAEDLTELLAALAA